MSDVSVSTDPAPSAGPPLAERPPEAAALPDPRGELLRLADLLRERRSAQQLHEFLRLRRALRT